MKKLFGALMLALFNLAVADLPVLTEGVEPGSWTMDMKEALVEAKKQKKPLLLFFTGSDWCSWCKKLEAQVLTQEVWKRFAKDHLILVYLDFPNDKSKVPEHFRTRNEQLSKKYEVEGFPTLILLDENEKKLEELHYMDSAELFIFQVKQPLRFHSLLFGKLTAGMPEAELTKLKQRRQKIAENAQCIQELQAQIKKLSKEMEAMEETTDRDMDNWIVKSGWPEKQEEYKTLSAKYEKLRKELQDWMKSAPPQNEENEKRFNQYRADIKALFEQVAKILSEAMNRK